ncbi:alpha/beta hydrolase [Christiangramia fulva]|uniref:Alpha/beta hydrolase n=1 Tax=Christiangramia fulva TaxID=2126553 RepID=A0A2R3Z660_9FLAO|nr:alpha/beta fold hydrolase [Christiangramia fulva]AVR45767.1 alpha/beta hydrolase [Christiangramia fulva]
MKKILTGFLIMLFTFSLKAQDSTFTEKEIAINNFTEGTLTLPTGNKAQDLVIFVQGSGPTDRNGNSPMAKNDGIKKIAHELAENGIASYRFDKRIFKMDKYGIKEKDLRFEDFVKDVEDIITYFKNSDQFKNIIVAGHSEGSLIGMLAAKARADAFISLAGAGEPFDNIIVEQLAKQAPKLAENARAAFDEMKKEGQTSNYAPMLQSIFRESVQPYMLSWIKYDPAEEIAKLNIPVLIINGTTDVQVDTKEAEMLKKGKPDAELILIDRMNHIFRKVDSDDMLVNTKTYNEPSRPLHPELIPALTKFIKDLK